MIKKILCLLMVTLLTISWACALTPPEIDAKAAIIVEKNSGEVLFELNADTPLPMASITKMMTCIIALENSDFDDPNNIVTVKQSTTDGLTARNSAVYLIPGEEMLFSDMLRYALVASGNDACNALAEHTFGSIEDFIVQMNATARQLGCTNTQFMNTHGLTEEGHYTTARDTAIIAMYAMENPIFAQVVTETQVVLPITNKHAQTTTKYCTNYLLSNQSQSGYRYEGAMGIKTGHTSAAGYCLASAVEKDDLTFFTVVLGAQKDEATGKIGSFVETAKLFDYAKGNFSTRLLLEATEPIAKIPVRLAANKEDILLLPEHSITALLPKDFKGAEELELDHTLEAESIDAPVEKGQALGTLTVKYNGKTYGTMSLIAAEGVERSEVLYVIDRVTSFLTGTTFKIIVAVLILLILLFIAYVIIVNRRRRKRRQRYGGNRYR